MRHGGDLAEARRRFGEPDEGWLDLSTGINPMPYPYSDDAIAKAVWTKLPQSDREETLRRAAVQAYGASQGWQVAIAPGSQALIQLVARFRAPCRVGIVGPTYSEHAIAWRREGSEIVDLADLSSESRHDCDVVVVTNPNNPDGWRIDVERLIDVAVGLQARQGLLVVDEAFCDLAPEFTLLSTTPRDGVIVLRSFGKFYGLAGVRLGFAFGCDDGVRQLAEWLGPWSVSGPAIEIGIQALSDRRWAGEARSRIQRASTELCKLFDACGLDVVGNGGLFVLAAHAQAARIADDLAARGIWVRRFENEPRWLRFGLPAGGQVERLAEALRDVTARQRTF